MHVIFRADASLEIGTGHVMRCLTLADELKTRGARCQFLCREHPGNLLEFIRQRGFEALGLPNEAQTFAPPDDDAPLPAHAAWLGVQWAEDAEQFLAALGPTRADWLVVDHYALDARWELALRPACHKLMVIDDLADRQHDCDLLLDQNFSLSSKSAYAQHVPANCIQLLGPRYALIRPEFRAFSLAASPRTGTIERLFLFFGGTDPGNMTGRILALLAQPCFAHLAVDVVVGQNHPFLESIKRQIDSREHTCLHINIRNMAEIMAQADLAIGAGGTATWERLCLGLPTLVVTIAENQTRFTADLHRAGIVTWLGSAESVTDDDIRQALVLALADTAGNRQRSTTGKATVSVQGADKVVKMMQQLHGETDPPLQQTHGAEHTLKITILSDLNSWLNEWIPQLAACWSAAGHAVHWVHKPEAVSTGQLCFILGCGKMLLPQVLKKNTNNLVVHESALPKGKGWSPLTWQILAGCAVIPITLFEAVESVDSGGIYLQDNMEFDGHELLGELHKIQALATIRLCREFVENYPEIVREAKPQAGPESFYPRRTPEDSRLDPTKTIADQFNILRVVDNTRYPAFFDHEGHRYSLTITKVR